MIVFWLLELQTVWSVVQWGSVIPDEMNLSTSMVASFPVRKWRILTTRSVPNQHLPVHPHGFLPYLAQSTGFDAFT